MRKWLLMLALVVGLGTAVIVWLGVEDAWQAALLDARVRAASDRYEMLLHSEFALGSYGAPRNEVTQAHIERVEAGAEALALRDEQLRREESWHARLGSEIRRRTGW